MLARKPLLKRNGYLLFTFVSQEDKEFAISELVQLPIRPAFVFGIGQKAIRRVEASQKAPLRLQRVLLVNPLCSAKHRFGIPHN